MSNHVYNLHRDEPDSRDYVFAAQRRILPNKVDHRDLCPPVYDQGDLGSCTANAACAAYDCTLSPKGPANLSRIYLYWAERIAGGGDVNQDSGSTIRQSVKSLAAGCCREDLWPYIPARFSMRPNKVAESDAPNHAAIRYSRVPQSVTGIKTAIARGYCVLIGIQVFESFETTAVAKTGIVPMPGKSEELLGGHAVLVVGYDGDMAIVRNSWGSSWGDDGYFRIPLAYLVNPSLASDLWVVEEVCDKEVV